MSVNEGIVMGDSYSVGPTQLQGVVTQVSGLAGSTGSTISQFSSVILAAASLATIGSSVAAANSTLQGNLSTALNDIVKLLQGINQLVGTAAQGYAAADTAVAQAYGGAPVTLAAATTPATSTPPATGPAVTPPSTTGRGPGNEGPLPPYNVKSPTTYDRALAFELDTDGLAYFRLEGWSTAHDALAHYLDGTGTDFTVDPGQLMHDVPKFDGTVQNYVTTNQGSPTFDSGWQNTNTDVQNANGTWGTQDMNTYYTMHDWRYRVSGTNTALPDGSTQTDYTVDVYKPYIFGAPRTDIRIPGVTSMTGYRLPQNDIQNLNSVGLARNFDIVGSHSYTTVTPPAQP